jgi:hypothetical protein
MEEPRLIIGSKGERYWYLGDYLHREDGPAVLYVNGDYCWYLHGEFHRTDGPAIEFRYYGVENQLRLMEVPRIEWYIHDQKLDCKTQEEFEHYMRLKAFW